MFRPLALLAGVRQQGLWARAISSKFLMSCPIYATKSLLTLKYELSVKIHDLFQARHSQDVMREIKTYIKERIEKTRQTYDSDNPRCLLEHYIQSCSKEDTEDCVSGKHSLLTFYSEGFSQIYWCN